MNGNYWSNSVTQNRITRRRLLAGSAMGGAGLAALSLIGCGSNSGRGGEKAAGLGLKPSDSTKQAKQGGTWVLHHPEEPPNIDPLTTQFFGQNFQAHFVYSRGVKYKSGTAENPPQGELEGDAFESWELSPDKMQLTFKLRNGLKFEPQAPVNGRAVTMDDVNWSWNRFISQHISRATFSNALNPEAPVVSMTTPDARTIVFKLAFPYVPIVSMFGINRGLVIQPLEAEKQFDARSEMHGSGPWMLTKFTPSVGLEYKRNPNYYMSDRPFIDNISRPIIKEYAQQLSQFEAGVLGAFVDARPDDIIPVRKRQPKLQMLAVGFAYDYPTMLQFDWRPTSPFKDLRIRQAFNMMIDRDLWIETFNNLKTYQAEGIDPRTRWHSHFSAGDDRYWLDPKGGKLGDASKYFKFDPAEAKKLLQAAGKEGIEFPMQYQSPSITSNQIEAFAQMFQQNGGVKPTLKPLDRNTWTTQCHTGGGNWDGICADLAAGAGADIDVWLDTRVRHKASAYGPYNADVPIAKIDELCKAQKKEFDEKKRTEIVLDVEREMANQMVALPYPGISERYQLAWPWLGNFGYVQGHSGGYAATEAYVNYWIDESKRNA